MALEKGIDRLVQDFIAAGRRRVSRVLMTGEPDM